MRIIAGKFRNRIIEMPKGIRPTSDKAREAIFEILKGRIEGASFLDLYCGSGAMGIEALSRGAKSVAFVDNNAKCTRALKRNLEKLGIMDSGDVHIYKNDVPGSFKVSGTSFLYFDIIFLDPPYYKDIAKNTLIELSRYDILSRHAIIIAEIYKKEELPENIGLLERFRVARYGDTKLEFFKIRQD